MKRRNTSTQHVSLSHPVFFYVNSNLTPMAIPYPPPPPPLFRNFVNLRQRLQVDGGGGGGGLVYLL